MMQIQKLYQSVQMFHHNAPNLCQVQFNMHFNLNYVNHVHIRLFALKGKTSSILSPLHTITTSRINKFQIFYLLTIFFLNEITHKLLRQVPTVIPLLAK